MLKAQLAVAEKHLGKLTDAESIKFVQGKIDSLKKALATSEDKLSHKLLTTSIAKTLIGKKIKWSVTPPELYANYAGVSIIKSIEPKKQKPIKSETISGDELDYSYYEYKGHHKQNGSNDRLSYGANGRHILFEIMESEKDSYIEAQHTLNEKVGVKKSTAKNTFKKVKGVGKIKKVMEEFKEGELKTPAGKKVTKRKQAIAIALSEQREKESGISKKKLAEIEEGKSRRNPAQEAHQASKKYSHEDVIKAARERKAKKK
jgi:hypothetical protein